MAWCIFSCLESHTCSLTEMVQSAIPPTDLTLANFEMAQFNRANLKNAVLREMYVSGATILTGVKDIEGSDWTDTMLRRDQTKYLCSHPTAKGTNPTTGVDTRESLMCID
mmetsp:Transcript_14519/g.42527  ORF Transcript_14519/g.42527 Transcript_14519/m.42527 type:complete len:110 (+) Transcript_14519:645-974(+)